MRLYGLAYRNRQFLLKILAVILLLIVAVQFLFDNQDEIEKFKDDIDLFSDENVKTNTYADEYQQYLNVKAEFKSLKDKKNIQDGIITRVSTSDRQLDTNKKNYLIVEYTKKFGDTTNCHRKQDAQLYVPQCPHTNCIFSCDRGDLKNADAVLFHEFDLVRVIDQDERYMRSALKWRHARQLWILWNDEPKYVEPYIDKYNFNWTMSYRYDAEIADCTYGCKYKRTDKYASEQEHLEQVRKNFNSRQKGALWLASNCLSMFRMKYALAMSAHFPVDVDGLCKYFINHISTDSTILYKIKYGLYFVYKLILNELFGQNFGAECRVYTPCEYKQLSQYKFYLSYESRNSSFYITEKFWRMLHTGLIPVCIQPSKKFYEAIAPANSFIHAEDFDYDIVRLTQHLHNVSKNFDLYSSYFKWRFDYGIVFRGAKNEQRRFCEFCRRLNEDTMVTYYNSVSAWFNND